MGLSQTKYHKASYTRMGTIPIHISGEYHHKASYTRTGTIPVHIFGELSEYYHGWPIENCPKPYDAHSYGKWFCDSYGINRDGNLCKIGDFSMACKMNKLDEDLVKQVQDHYVSY